MTPARACFLMLLLAAVLSARAQDFLSTDDLYAAGLTKYWQLALPLEPDQRLTDVHLVGDQIYAATQDGYVFAVHARTGATRWFRQVTRSGYRVWRPAHGGKAAVFVSPGEVLLLDRQFGDGISRRSLPFPAGCGPVSDGEQYFICGLDARMYAFSLADNFENWKVLGAAPLTSIPVLYNDHLYFADDSGVVYACHRSNKRGLWQSRVTGAITADLAVSERGVFAASRDNSLYLLDLSFGRVRWRARLSGPLYEPPVVTPNYAYQYCPDDGLVSIATEVMNVEERIAWKLPQGRTALSIHQDVVFVLSRTGEIHAIGVEDGRIRHTIAAPGFSLYAPDVEATSLILASPDGRIFCARPRGLPYVQREDVLAALSAEESDDSPGGSPTTQAAPETTPSAPPVAGSSPTLRGPIIGGKSKVTKEFERNRSAP